MMGDEETKADEDVKIGEETIKGMISALKQVSCMFCTGWGHKAKQCSTLKAMNSKCADAPLLKSAWGKSKAKFLAAVT